MWLLPFAIYNNTSKYSFARSAYVMAFGVLLLATDHFFLFSIIYRDVKQENMGFDVRGDIKLFDFGLAKCLDGLQKTTDGYLLTAHTGTNAIQNISLSLVEYGTDIAAYIIPDLALLHRNYSVHGSRSGSGGTIHCPM